MSDFDAVLDAAADVRRNHAPNEWDSCVYCQKVWPCDAELLAELVVTRASLSSEPASTGLDVERLRAAFRGYNLDTDGPDVIEAIAAEYARLSVSSPQDPT